MGHTSGAPRFTSRVAINPKCCDDHWNARSWVLGDVGDPKLVRQISRELSINQILCRGQWWDIVTFTASSDALNIGTLHKKRHGTVTHIDPQTLRQFRVHPPCSVNATSISVHLTNDISEPYVAHTAHRRDLPTLRVKTAFRHVKYSTAPLNLMPSGDHHCDGRLPAFGLVVPFNNSVANS